MFFVTEVDPVEAGADLFASACWYHPFQAEPVRLFDVPTPASGGGREYAFASGMMGQEAMLRFYRDINERPPMTSLEADLDEFV